jgi:NAD(P)-dependent dehydrogenase (short-subunit alcohol dehydrogenase family)
MAGISFDLTGKIAAVTGGTGALGKTICHTLAQAGATVVIMARTQANAEDVAHAIQQLGQSALGLGCDVLDQARLQSTADHILAQYGRIDILVNGAGGNQPGATAIPNERTFFELSHAALQTVFDLNLMGTLLPCQVFGKHMAEQGSGVILNLSSMASFTPLTRVVAYGAAKAAINNFTQWLAVYMAQQYSPQIRVNALAPGFFLGEQNRFLLLDQTTGDLTPRGQQIISHTPMGRFGNPDDLAGTTLWLVSDASQFVTGIVVPVDGGFSAFSGV